MEIRPFAAVTPIPNMAAKVSSPPYDVMDGTEARAMVAGKPESFLRVTRSEVDLPPNIDPYSDAVYAKALENYERLIDDGIMVRSEAPELFIYRQARHGNKQTSVMACVSVAEYEAGVIRKHEKTRADKEADRTKHIETVRAQTGPVFLAYRDVEAISEQMRRDMNDRPRFHFVADDAVTHTVWRVNDPDVYVEMFKRVPRAYIADGHHRAASAANVARGRLPLPLGEGRGEGVGLKGTQGETRPHPRPLSLGERGDEAQWFMAALFPASELTILPYHRLIKNLGDLTPEEIVKRLRELGSVTDTHWGEAEAPGVFCVYLDGVWRRVELDPAIARVGQAVPAGSQGANDDPTGTACPTEALDVSLVQRLVLEPMFGICDVRRDQRIDFLGGVHGPEGVAKRVDEGAAKMGISMHATTMEQLLAVADAGLIMPPKSTWFEPKLRDGLMVHEI